MPRRSARSRSRGRPDTYKAAAPKAKIPKTPKAEAKPKLDFAEGAAVMARWPFFIIGHFFLILIIIIGGLAAASSSKPK